MSFLRAFALLLVTFLLPLASKAVPLGSFFELLDGTFTEALSPTIFVSVCFGPPLMFGFCEADAGGAVLFADHRYSSADAGSTFVATSANEAAFATAAQLLTNGVNDNIEVDWGPFTLAEGNAFGSGSTEANRFFGDPSGASGIDFAGFAIDSIDLTFSDNFSVTPDASSDTTTVVGGITVQVFGHLVPEPSTASLVGLGLAGLLLRRGASVG